MKISNLSAIYAGVTPQSWQVIDRKLFNDILDSLTPKELTTTQRATWDNHRESLLEAYF